MSIIDGIVAPLAGLLDKIIPDPRAREAAKRELLRLEGTQELERIKAQMGAILAEASSPDPWTSRARPSFLYVMYAMILFALPMGVLAAFSAQTAQDIGAGITSYLRGLPEELYALFCTGYLGYTAARQWGKIKGVEQ